MKKLKVILPAILTLAVSTSAAVTGTVAWFTANRLQTVKMTGITAVNPESGLILENVVDNGNTKVDFDDNASPKWTVTHGKQVVDPDAETPVYNDVYLRDASVNMGVNTTPVYRAILDEADGYTGFETVASPYKDADGKQYNGKGVVYATAFTASFKATADEGTSDPFKYCLFLDLYNSSVTAPTQYINNNAINNAKDGKLLQALRIGFRCGNEWLVWAPLSTDGVRTGATGEQYDIKFVNGTTKTTNEVGYEDANLYIGNNAAGVGEEVPTDSNADGYAANTVKTTCKGYLGELDKTTALDVKVVTWFDGLDKYCKNDYFTDVLKDIQSNLQFVMRRVGN